MHIHIYPNEVLIYNNGKLPDDWTADDLFSQHTSMPHNPWIASAFFRSGQIEAWGRGVKKITDACKEWGKPEPFYRINRGVFRFWIRLNEVKSIGGSVCADIFHQTRGYAFPLHIRRNNETKY
ncbi:MAG: hypothetical protein LBH17_07845 [Oscillospiraceae bacterium]|nr:hypothetical protein [Oscillospiraceae bacterium]